MKLRTRKNYVLIAAVRGKKKYKNLYTPQKQSYSDFFALIPVWVLQLDEDSKLRVEGVSEGVKCAIYDAFELDPLPRQDFSGYDIPQDCIQEAIDGDGFIEFNVVHEDALIGVADELKGSRSANTEQRIYTRGQ